MVLVLSFQGRVWALHFHQAGNRRVRLGLAHGLRQHLYGTWALPVPIIEVFTIKLYSDFPSRRCASITAVLGISSETASSNFVEVAYRLCTAPWWHIRGGLVSSFPEPHHTETVARVEVFAAGQPSISPEQT
jgi:hypothetical protein